MMRKSIDQDLLELNLKIKIMWVFAIRIAFILSLATVISCTGVFFDQPQPTDSQNLRYVPKEIQGTWKHTRVNYEESIIIDKTSYHRISIEKYSIAIADLDTLETFKIADGKIYFLKGNINIGFPFKILNDTIHFSERYEDALILSDSVLLRPAKNCLIGNLRKKNWWEIIFIQKTKKGEIRICYPNVDNLLKMRSKYNITVLDSTKKDSMFFHVNLKSKNIEKLLRKDGSIIINNLNPDSTFSEPS